MAKKRPAPVPPPPPAESSDEEDIASSDEEDEEEPTNAMPTKIPANPNPKEPEEEEEDEETDDADEGDADDGEEEESSEEEEEEAEDDANAGAGAGADADNNKIPAPADSGSGSGSGSEPDSDSDPDPPKAVKPISSKPMPPEPAAPPSPVPTRKARDDDKTGAGGSAAATGPFFQRVWSLDDEIGLLGGVLEYKSKTGAVPLSFGPKGFADFPEFIKRFLSMEVTDVQLSDKIRRFKKKYDRASARGYPHFANPHDRTTFELSEKIWGNGGRAGSEEHMASANGTEDGAVGGAGGYLFLREAIARLDDFGSKLALEALEKLDPGKARMLEEKFRKHKMVTMKLHLHKMELQKDTFKLIMEGVDRSA